MILNSGDLVFYENGLYGCVEIACKPRYIYNCISQMLWIEGEYKSGWYFAEKLKYDGHIAVEHNNGKQYIYYTSKNRDMVSFRGECIGYISRLSEHNSEIVWVSGFCNSGWWYSGGLQHD